MKKGYRLRKVLLFLSIAVFISVFIYQFAALKMNAVTTETVVETTEQETIAAKLFIVRDEHYIINQTSGTVVPLVEDGKKVAKGDVVAAICGNESEASVYMQKKELQSSILRYTQLNRQENENALDIDKIDEEADLLFTKMMDVVSTGKLEEFNSSSSDFRDKLTNRQITIDGSIDFSAKINALEKELTALQKKDISVSNLSANESGYYISSLDGYENKINYNNIQNVTASEIEKIINSTSEPGPSGALGKLVYNYNWYLLASLKKSDAIMLKTGQTLKINFGPDFEDTISVKVYSVNLSQNGNTAVAFVCNLMNSQLAGMRIENARIVLKEYKGYRINSNAVRIRGGVEGAYVLLGDVITFRKFDIKYSNKNYVIADIVKNTYETKKPYYIELYDEAIIKGKNLREGRVVG